MATEITTEKRLLCPSCAQKGKRVSLTTLRALLKDDELPSLPSDGQAYCNSGRGDGSGCKPPPEDTGYRFCESPGCDVVYFAEQGEATFTKPQLRVAVGVKETAGERPLCYCFGHSVASIKQELRAKGRSGALDDIRAKMKDPGCRCETENPSGACCLGSVAKGIQIAQDEMNVRDVPPAGAGKPRWGRGETFAKIGTVVAAIMASACCWLPLLLLALGISGAGMASALEAYRPLFIVVTFGFLAAAFYFTYRPRKAAGRGHACCGPEATEAEECCQPSTKAGPGRRFNVMTLNKAMLWVVTVLAVAFLFFPSYIGVLLGTRNQAGVTSNMNQAVVTVEGMSCEGCVAIVAKAIRGVPGVLAVEVDYEKAEAVVGTEICCPAPKDEILAALRAAGYSGTFVDTNATSASAADAGAQSADACCSP